MSRLREAMRATLRSFTELRGEPRLVRVEASFLLFSIAELATWLAMLIYTFQQGGAAAAQASGIGVGGDGERTQDEQGPASLG